MKKKSQERKETNGTNYQPFVEDTIKNLLKTCKKYNVNFDDALKNTYYSKYNKEIFKELALQGLRLFIKDHPEVLEGKWILSIAKRIAGQMYTHFINNKGGK